MHLVVNRLGSAYIMAWTALLRRCMLGAAPLAVVLVLLSNASVTFAHVIVTPQRSVPGVVEPYVITVQCERPLPTTRITVQIPSGLRVVAFQPAPGWHRTIQHDRAGKPLAVTWSGGLLLPEEFVEFGLLARNPDRSVPLVWKARQIYQDGFPVDWTGTQDSIQPAAVTSLSNAVTPQATYSGYSVGWASADLELAVALFTLGCSMVIHAVLILALRRVLV